MKDYKQPELEIETFAVEDIITPAILTWALTTVPSFNNRPLITIPPAVFTAGGLP